MVVGVPPKQGVSEMRHLIGSSRRGVSFAVLTGLVFLASCGDDGNSAANGPTTSGAESTEAPAENLKVTQAGLLPFFSTVWPTVIAKHEGFFEERGLDVEFAWGFEGPQVFAGGNADILCDSSEKALLVQSGGSDIVVFKPLATRVTTWLVSNNEVTSIEQLRGKTVAVSEIGGTDHFLIVELLKKHGLAEGDVDYVKVASDQQLAAIASGNVDAALPDEVFAVQASDAGEVTLLADSADFDPYPWTLLHARKAWMEENPDAAKAYAEAIDEAIEFIMDTANREAVVTDVVEESGGAAQRETIEVSYDLVTSTPDYYTTTLDPDVAATAIDALEFLGALDASDPVDIEAYLSGLSLVQ
jgi:NitT/TauT family transport system substrate-binding protein